MLLHQGAAAFTLWTGQPAPLDLMQAQARRGTRRRHRVGRGRAGRRGRRRGRRAEVRTATRGMGRFRVPDGRGIARPGARARSSRASRPGCALTADAASPSTSRAASAGYGRGARQTIEHDRAEILGGVRHGLTLGSPILLLVRNRDWENWTQVMAVEPLTTRPPPRSLAAAEDGNKRAMPVTRVRPGHADLAGALKYGFNDVRNVLERSSARETTARVAAGGVARAFLASSASRSGRSPPRSAASRVDPAQRRRARATRPTPSRSAARTRTPRRAMIARIDEARSNGDSVGGVFEVVARGLPIGLGSYVHWDRRLDAALAAAVMSINIIKGVEFGLGFEQTRRFGSAVHDVIERRDEMGRWIHRSNNAGGLTGGVSNGAADRGARRRQADLDDRATAADGGPRSPASRSRRRTTSGPTSGSCPRPASSARRWSRSRSPTFVLDKFGGDSLDESRDNLERYRARHRGAAPEAPVAGRAGDRRVAAPTGDAPSRSDRPDEVGSGGDD